MCTTQNPHYTNTKLINSYWISFYWIIYHANDKQRTQIVFRLILLKNISKMYKTLSHV